MSLECKDGCRHFVSSKRKDYEGVSFYCKICEGNYLLELLSNGKCGCCHSRVRLKPKKKNKKSSFYNSQSHMNAPLSLVFMGPCNGPT